MPYLAGVAHAGFWDVTVVHSVSTHHTSLLVLGENISTPSVTILAIISLFMI